MGFVAANPTKPVPSIENPRSKTPSFAATVAAIDPVSEPTRILRAARREVIASRSSPCRKPPCGRLVGCSRLQPHATHASEKNRRMPAQSLRNASCISSTPNTNLRTTNRSGGPGAHGCVEPTPPTALPQLPCLSARQFRLRLQFSRTLSPRLPKQREGTGHGVRGFPPAEPATASVLSLSLTGLPARFTANGSRLPCRARSLIRASSVLTACLAAGLRPARRPRGNHVRSFPRNTARHRLGSHRRRCRLLLTVRVAADPRTTLPDISSHRVTSVTRRGVNPARG